MESVFTIAVDGMRTDRRLIPLNDVRVRLDCGHGQSLEPIEFDQYNKV